MVQPRYLSNIFKFAAISLLLVGSTAYYGEASDFSSLREKVSKITLENGLRIVYVENDAAPVFSAQVWVKVGGADELPGASGAAHLLEHMAFKGTETLGTRDIRAELSLIHKFDTLFEQERTSPTEDGQRKLKEIESRLEEIWDIGAFTSQYQTRGANGLNAGTSKDYTVYTVSLPSSELEFLFSIESERILRPVFRQFYKELDVVHEERRMRTDDSPSGKLYEALLATAYWDHPYGVPTIGWKQDLDNLVKSDAEHLHRTYYRPDNIVISIAGDVSGAEVERLAKKYFNRLPKPDQPLPERRVFPEIQNGERTAQVLFASEPEFMIAYHVPTAPDPSSLHFNLVSSILDDGRSSIFQRILVRDEQLMISVSSGEAPGNRYDPVFIVHGTPRSDVSVDTAVARIQSILDDLGEALVTEELLDAAKKRIKVDVLNRLQRNAGMARSLGVNELLFGGWETFFEELEELDSISVEDVRETAKKYFRVNNRTVVRIRQTTGENN
jgi:predicted Zn-dependent peptidase